MSDQGLLKVWTEHSHWFLLNWKLLEISQQKFQHFYNLGRNEFSPNSKGVAQKLGPPRPFEVLDIFNFQKLFLYVVGDTWKKKNLQISISQKWFEISSPNFHHLLTSIGTRSVPNMKGIAHLKRLPRPWEVQNWNGRSGSIFWATPSKFGENSFPPKL